MYVGRLDSLVGAREDLSVCLSWIDAGSRGVLWWQIGGSVSRRALQFTFGCRLQVKDILVELGRIVHFAAKINEIERFRFCNFIRGIANNC